MLLADGQVFFYSFVEFAGFRFSWTGSVCYIFNGLFHYYTLFDFRIQLQSFMLQDYLVLDFLPFLRKSRDSEIARTAESLK